ncbi:MAG TPA: hypothetical protein VGR18_05040 [Rubrobacter sp.]|nr:hypothetical protein [Rubrobacter sp.]
MIRVLVALAPRMYREAIVLSIHRNRPGLDVRGVPPEDASDEVEAFRPHLLVHNDSAPIPEGTLVGVPWRVEVLYSDSMDTLVRANGKVSQMHDMSTEDLLRAVDDAAELAGWEPAQG